MSKFKIIVATAIVVASLMVGCSVVADNTNGFSNSYVSVIVDYETGVNYLVYQAPYKGGITVRYDSDGKVYVNK